MVDFAAPTTLLASRSILAGLLHVAIAGAVTYDTDLSWTAVPGAAAYRAWWRDSLDPVWSHSKSAGDALSIKLANVNIDDWLFGATSISADGYESPVAFPFADQAVGVTLTTMQAAMPAPK